MFAKRDKITIIIDNIITPYEIARYNEINNFIHGRLEVWFQRKSEKNRNWQDFPKINFRYKLLNNLSPIFVNPAIFRMLNEYKGRVDRIICCGWDTLTYLYTFWFCKQNKIRSTLWSGNTEFDGNWRRNIFLPIIKIIIHWSDDYIAYGIRAKKYLENIGIGADKIKIFLNSVSVDFFQREAKRLKKKKQELRNKYGIHREDKVFIYVGQLIERKGIKELIKAFSNLSKNISNLTLIIVGEGELKNSIQSIIDKTPWAKIRLMGFVQYAHLPELYAVSDALILPSKQEVWGLVVNEALASDLPVIVSKFAGASEDLVTKDNGVIINDPTVSDIQKSLNIFLDKGKYNISSDILEKMRNNNYVRINFHERPNYTTK